MSARAAGRANSQQTGARGHRHANAPNREELQRQLERRQREIDKLREQVTERDKQIAEQGQRIAEQAQQIVEKERQIADLERQLAARRKNSTNSSKPPSSDGLAGEQRARGRRR